MSGLSTAEMLALAVLQKDDSAIPALLDCLLEEYSYEKRPIPLTKRLPVDVTNVQAVLYFKDHALDGLQDNLQENMQRIRESVATWLRGEVQTLLVQGVERVELYEWSVK